jgi:hypothetical protein
LVLLALVVLVCTPALVHGQRELLSTAWWLLVLLLIL